MTEKRFTLSEVFLLDKPCISDNGNDLRQEDVVALLNEQHEEIAYLEKKKCDYWNKYNQAYLDSINFKKENEQLKQLNIPLDEVKDTVIDYKGRITGVYYND